MKRAKPLIYKLRRALNKEGIIVKISTEEFYSVKHEKLFTKHKVQFTTKEEIKLRSELYNLKQKKKYETGKEKRKIEDSIEDIDNKIKKITYPKQEFFKEIDVLLYLADKYKEVKHDG